MRWMIATLIALFMAASVSNAQAERLCDVTPDYDQERDDIATQSAFNDLAGFLSSDPGQPVNLAMAQNAERGGERIRTNACAMLPAPAQLVCLAMRNALPHQGSLASHRFDGKMRLQADLLVRTGMEGGRLPGASRLLT